MFTNDAPKLPDSLAHAVPLSRFTILRHILVGERRPVVVVRQDAGKGNGTGLAVGIAGELRVAVHEQEIDAAGAVRAVGVRRQVFKEEYPPRHAAGKAGFQRPCGGMGHLGQFVRRGTAGGGKLREERVVVIIRAGDGDVGGSSAAFWSFDGGKLDVKAAAGVGRAEIAGAVVRADVGVHQVGKIEERGHPPAIAGIGKHVPAVRSIQVLGHAELFEVGNAVDAVRLLFGRRQRGQ